MRLRVQQNRPLQAANQFPIIPPSRPPARGATADPSAVKGATSAAERDQAARARDPRGRRRTAAARGSVVRVGMIKAVVAASGSSVEHARVAAASLSEAGRDGDFSPDQAGARVVRAVSASGR